MIAKRIRAVVLAAGRGSRLRPLTDFRPKPLLPLVGKAIVERTLDQLVALGCEAIALNLHHLADEISDYFGDSYGGIPLTYSREVEIQGTLGGLIRLREFLLGGDLSVVINGDSACRWPLARVIKRFQKADADAALLLSSLATPTRFGGGVTVDKDNQVVSFRAQGPPSESHRRQVFAGVHVFHPQLLNAVPAVPADIVSNLYEPLLREGRKFLGVSTRRVWHDLGTPESYLVGSLDWARRESWLRSFSGGRALGSWVAKGARVKRSVLESEAVVEREARVSDSLLLPGSRLGRGCRVQNSIVGFGVRLPPRTTLQNRMVTTRQANYPVEEEDSVVGGLVYSPLVRSKRRSASTGRRGAR